MIIAISMMEEEPDDFFLRIFIVHATRLAQSDLKWSRTIAFLLFRQQALRETFDFMSQFPLIIVFPFDLHSTLSMFIIPPNLSAVRVDGTGQAHWVAHTRLWETTPQTTRKRRSGLRGGSIALRHCWMTVHWRPGVWCL